MACGCQSACGCDVIAGPGIQVSQQTGGRFIIANTSPGNAGSYIHEQAVPATTWSVVHNLARFPQVTTVDSAGTVVEGDIQYLDNNNIEVNFAAPFSGRAFIGG